MELNKSAKTMKIKKIVQETNIFYLELHKVS